MCTILLCARNLALLPPWRYAAGSLYSPEIAYLVNCSRYGSAAAGDGRRDGSVRMEGSGQFSVALLLSAQVGKLNIGLAIVNCLVKLDQLTIGRLNCVDDASTNGRMPFWRRRTFADSQRPSGLPM